MAVRYVLDAGVARDLLAREPHLRSVITLEEYKLPDEIRSPDQLTKVLTEAVAGQSIMPGTMYVTSFHQKNYVVSRSVSEGTTWEAHYDVYGFFPE